MENKEPKKCIKVEDGDMLSAICLALRKAADSKAEKDWKLNKQSPVEDRRDC